MNTDQLDAMLRETLEDYELSRGERKSLRQLFQNSDKSTLDYVRHRAFEIARRETTDRQAANVIEWLEDVNKVLIQANEVQHNLAEAWFSPEDDCPARICELFHQAERSIDICLFTITDDRLAEAIQNAHARKKQVRIISDNQKANDKGSDIYRLKRDGIPVRVDASKSHMHHKFAIFDKQVLLTGSYNWTRGAAEHNHENFIVASNDRLVKEFDKKFEELWKRWK